MRRITDDQPRSIRDQNALIPEWLERGCHETAREGPRIAIPVG